MQLNKKKKKKNENSQKHVVIIYANLLILIYALVFNCLQYEYMKYIHII